LCVYGKLIALPPLAAANQPLKEKPNLEGVPGLEEIDPPVIVVPFEMELPP
jgi:hypothetical protein